MIFKSSPSKVSSLRFNLLVCMSTVAPVPGLVRSLGRTKLLTSQALGQLLPPCLSHLFFSRLTIRFHFPTYTASLPIVFTLASPPYHHLALYHPWSDSPFASSCFRGPNRTSDSTTFNVIQSVPSFPPAPRSVNSTPFY